MSEKTVSPTEGYPVAFRLGLWGCLFLSALGLLTRNRVVLLALAAWTLIVLFFIPWFYARAIHAGYTLPEWASP